MNITPSALDAIFYNFDKRFQGGYSRAEKWADKLSTEVPSTSRSVRHAWLKWIPRLREWVGERKVNNAVARAYEVINKSYELTEGVSTEDIADDQIGVYGPLMEMMGQQAALWPEDLLKAAIQAGTTALAFDGQAFFSTSHPVDTDDSSKGTYSNLMTSSALNAANYNTARARMLGYLAEDGKPMKVNPGLLVIPPALEETAKQILNAEFIAPVAAVGMNAANVMQGNTLKGTADILVLSDLADEADAWYLLDTSKPVKPFLFQLRKAPSFVALTDPTSKNVFFDKEFIYGTDARGAASYSFPFLALRGKA